MQEIYWHLPGFCVNFYLNQIIINLMKEYPEKFHEGYRVGSVYGTFPGAIWNGGRAVFGISAKSDMEQIIETYNKAGVPVRFTWTNSVLQKEHCYDTYCNLIMNVADNGKNQVLVNTEVLETYLKEKYPNFEYISSTTKRIKELEDVKKELEKGYKLVVLDYDLNHDEKVLKALEPDADKIEILVDEVCFPNCPKRSAHYRDESVCQLNFVRGSTFDCPNKKTVPSFDECKKRPAFISKEEIGKYIDRGYVNFKLVGRGLPQQMVIESYLYYLVKDEAREFIKEKLEKTLVSLTNKARR